MAGDETEAARLREALSRMEGRSPLLGWLRRNRAELEAQFAINPPRWASVASVLAELGVVDAKGQPPKPAAVRLAWSRVRAAAPPSVVAPVVAPLTPTPAPPLRPPAFDPHEGEANAPAAPRFTFNRQKATPR